MPLPCTLLILHKLYILIVALWAGYGLGASHLSSRMAALDTALNVAEDSIVAGLEEGVPSSALVLYQCRLEA
jgi:hypothetical protein